jgi:hypothetical protein
MPPERERLAALIERIGRFVVRDRRLARVQRAMETHLQASSEPPPAEVAAYLAAARAYFSSFEREARDHLRDVDARLAHASQVQFNLTAERGVAERRVAATQGVLADVAELGA